MLSECRCITKCFAFYSLISLIQQFFIVIFLCRYLILVKVLLAPKLFCVHTELLLRASVLACELQVHPGLSWQKFM